MRRRNDEFDNFDTTYTPTKISRTLKEYFDENGVKQAEIAKELNITQSAVCNQLHGRPFGKNSAQQWSDTFGFDMGWLMTGEGECFKARQPRYILSADKCKINCIINDTKTLPIIPAWMFRAPNINIDDCINNKNYKKILEMMSYVHHFKNHDIYARCPGDAMSPKICKGDIVALKRIDIENVTYDITKLYGINITTKGFILRKIRDNHDGTLTCIPANLDKFEPFNINKANVVECFEVVGIMNIIND